MTQPTLMPANLGTLIQRLLESVGRTLNGLGTLNEISFSQKLPTTAIIHIDLCVRNSDMEAIMEANPIPSPANLSFPSTLSRTSSPNTLRHSLHIYHGRTGLMVNYGDTDTLLPLLEEDGGSLEDEMILPSYGKRLHMTLKLFLLIWPPP